MEKESFETSESLEKLHETISMYDPEGPVSFRTEKAKVEYLFNAVAGFEGAKVPLMQFYSDDPSWNFHQLSIALDNSWPQEGTLSDKPLSASRNSLTVL